MSDTIADDLIVKGENEMHRVTNTRFLPTTAFERFKGDGSKKFKLRNTPVLRVVQANIDGTTIAGSDIIIEPFSGIMKLSNDATESTWNMHDDEKNRVKYIYAKLVETTTETETNGAVTSGSAKTIAVDSATGLSQDNYIKIEGLDGNFEVTTIDGLSGTNITADITYDHEDGSRVVKMETPELAKRLALVLSGIYAALYMVGSTYTFATSYSIPHQTVTKGVPYPHFEKVLNSLVDERDRLIPKLRQIPIE